MSRLERLLSLLETGSSPVTRKMAACQLGEVQRLHPHEMHNLLNSVTNFLYSSCWDTRIAAGHAIEAILANVPKWEPSVSSEEQDNSFRQRLENEKMTFSSFNFDNVVAKSDYLMGSEGKQFELQNPDKNDIEKQKVMVNAKLGLDVAAYLGFDMDSIYTSEDLQMNNTPSEPSDKIPVGELVSMREANLARRRARMKHKSSQQVDHQPEVKKIKLETHSLPVPDDSGLWSLSIETWPLNWFCDRLCSDVFSSTWEVRHGAGIALRLLLKTHGSSGGKLSNLPPFLAERYHRCWLEDIALRLVCVLTLDRFGDFVFDQVVAPVRETCAQALGTITLLMNQNQVLSLVSILLKLVKQKDWEARHGGLLGIKYTFAVREDMVNDLIPLCFDTIHDSLCDCVDDVGAVAGAALSIAIKPLTSYHPEFVRKTFRTLAAHIPQLDDLTPTANTFVPLVVDLLNNQDVSSHLRESEEIEKLVTRVWTLMEHNNESVRKAALETLSALASHHTFQMLTLSMRHIFQRALVEHCPKTIAIIKNVWCEMIDKSKVGDVLLATCPIVTNWLCLAMQPSRIAFDPLLLIRPKLKTSAPTTQLKLYIGGAENISSEHRELNAVEARILSAQLLGYLSKIIVEPAPGVDYSGSVESPLDCYTKVLTVYLDSKSALQRFITGLVMAEWGRTDPPSTPPLLLVNKINECLSETVYYDEIASSYPRLLQETSDFLLQVKRFNVPSLKSFENQSVFTLDQMEKICSDEISPVLAKKAKELEDKRKTLKSSIVSTKSELTIHHVRVQSALAAALLNFGKLPNKLGPVVKPLMDSIKTESNRNLQRYSGEHLAKLVEVCLPLNPSPNEKIVKNLCTYLRCDPEFTPRIVNATAQTVSLKKDKSPEKNRDKMYNGIITLVKQEMVGERKPGTGRGPGRPPANSVDKNLDIDQLTSKEKMQEEKSLEIEREGAIFTLSQIVSRLGKSLPEKLPSLWAQITENLRNSVDPSLYDPAVLKLDTSAAEQLVASLQVLEVTVPAIHEDIFPQVLSLMDCLVCLVYHPFEAVRHMSARCISSLSSTRPDIVIPLVIKQVLPLLSAHHSLNMRQGAIETIAILIDKMRIQLIPYVTFLIIPLMGRMSDQDVSVRSLASHTFANVIQLMPLDTSRGGGGVGSGGGVGKGSPKLEGELAKMKQVQQSFLHQLFHPETILDFKIPVPIKADLRSYQQAGLNWLWFLNKYKLHGILCDDMGLGKTLQSICILASDHFLRQNKYMVSKDPDCAPLPSLVVCPPTLTGHWYFEVKKFISHKHLNPLQFIGNPIERKKLRCKVKNHNLIIASYDIVRNDIDYFGSIKWNYCILDEGHIIKNGKTKSTKAIKTLEANNRLILSGTPIQNNVLELWSLFDFLMPGFLGTEKQFNARYSKPILASRDPKSTSKEQEAGVLAMEALHRKVLPFVLRRLKEDVLKELPPKITQDYYCDLSPLQLTLYEDFSRSHSLNTSQSHIFQALRYMQSVCNHPKLALTPKHPQYEKLMTQLQENNSSLSDINHAAKLPALRQLLYDCGIGVNGDRDESMAVVNQHRALIFCQLNAMLDIIENDLLKQHMPSVSYLRLDRNVPSSKRTSIVTQFNNDPSIDVLLLTTQVGGLGLNLTGADTVIFIEHDWSPMRDLQAMDRAYRIGQKKVVNVYRLITRGTLEEKIMGLQKFKLMTANTVISTENASLQTMATDKLMELLSVESSSTSKGDNGGSVSGVKSILESLPPLWEEDQYQEEYNVNNFIKNLNT